MKDWVWGQLEVKEEVGLFEKKGSDLVEGCLGQEEALHQVCPVWRRSLTAP